MSLKYGEVFKLIINEEASFDDGLSILLFSFSHKHSLVGGPTKATAYITLTKDNLEDNILLSVHGKDEDTTVENFDALRWNEYEFKLKGFNYDRNIELIVIKRN